MLGAVGLGIINQLIFVMLVLQVVKTVMKLAVYHVILGIKRKEIYVLLHVVTVGTKWMPQHVENVEKNVLHVQPVVVTAFLVLMDTIMNHLVTHVASVPVPVCSVLQPHPVRPA